MAARSHVSLYRSVCKEVSHSLQKTLELSKLPKIIELEGRAISFVLDSYSFFWASCYLGQDFLMVSDSSGNLG